MAIETTSDLSLVGTSQIVDGSVTSAKIGAGAVGSAALSSGAVGSAAIAAASVGTAAISSGAATSGQILQANGSGAVTFATPAAGGGYTLLATATPSAATSLSFGSISGSYKHLFLIWRNVRQSAQDVGWAVRLNNDSGTNYRFHLITFDESSMSPVYNLTNREEFGVLINDSGVIPSTGSADDANVSTGYLWVYRYTESESKILMSRATGEGTSSFTMRTDIEGTYTGTSAITSIDFIRQDTQTITGTFFLYGVS